MIIGDFSFKTSNLKKLHDVNSNTERQAANYFLKRYLT